MNAKLVWGGSNLEKVHTKLSTGNLRASPGIFRLGNIKLGSGNTTQSSGDPTKSPGNTKPSNGKLKLPAKHLLTVLGEGGPTVNTVQRYGGHSLEALGYLNGPFIPMTTLSLKTWGTPLVSPKVAT